MAEGYLFQGNPKPYDPNYDPVLEERRRIGRSGGNPLTVADASQVPFFGPAVGATLGPGGILNPSPHAERPPAPIVANTDVGVQNPAPLQLPKPNDSPHESNLGMTAPETISQPNRTLEQFTGPGLSATVDRSQGLSGQAWLDSARTNPNHAWHDASMGNWSDPNAGNDTLGTHDPRPNEQPDMRGGQDFGNGGEGYLFSGAGTQADDEGRLRLGQLRIAQADQARTLADPFAEQRLKGQFDVQRAVQPALIGAQADRDVANLQGQNAIGKEEAQYASYDDLVDQQLQLDVQQAAQQAQTSGHPGWQEAFKRRAIELYQQAQQAKLKIREYGVGGRPNPLEALYGGLGQQVPVPNQQ